MDDVLRSSNKVRKQAYKAAETGAAEVAEKKLPLVRKFQQVREGFERKAEELRQKSARVVNRVERALSGKRVGPLPFLALCTVLCVSAVVNTVYTPSYLVHMDGVALGVVSNPQVFEGVMERVESRASAILGYDYQLEGVISYERALTERDKLPAVSGFETYLFDQIGEVMKSYVLTVDGQVIGAAVEKATLDHLLDSLKAPYMGENTITAEFIEPVYISHQYAPADTQQDLDVMKSTLTANTTGQTTYIVQKGDTFMALALENDMTMADLEALNPGMDINKLMIGQVINIKKIIPALSVRTVNSITYNEVVPAPVEEVQDDTMYQGDKKVLSAGSDGTAVIAADVTYLNGQEQSRAVNNVKVVAEPTTRVVAVGTKERPKTMATGHLIWPLNGHITSSYGYRSIFGSYSYHSGLDIAAPFGTGISASDGGTVIFSGTQGTYGKLIIIDHGNGLQTYYGHCSSLLVSEGEKVYQGQTIAKVGRTGRATGNHCHFQVKVNGTTVSPISYLN